MRFLPALRKTEMEPVRDQAEFSLDGYIEYLNQFIYNGNGYITQGVNQTMPGQRQEPIGPAYQALTELAYKSDSVVFACMQTRAYHFAQVRFQFSQMNNGRRGKLFGTQDLQPLEAPWSGGTTYDLLTKMIQHADLAGNAFVVKRGDGLALLRPDWVTIIIGSDTDPELGAWATDADIIGYVYSPGGYNTDGYETETYLPEEVAHFAPTPDPEARFRGMSWLTPLIREVMSDKAATEHKLKFFENPTPNMVVKFDVPDLEEYKKQVSAFKDAHMGARNAYKWMFTTAGVDTTVVGSNMHDLDYKLITGAGETRIAAAARTPPVLVGLSEGLQGSSLNAGNYQAARRHFVDELIRSLWTNAAGSLANIITVPGGAELWYDDRDVSFLKEDAQERAQVELAKAQTVRFYVDSGFLPDSVIAAVEAEDMSLLEHSGLYSVQLQPANAPKQGIFTGVPTPIQDSSKAPTETTAPDGGTPPAGNPVTNTPKPNGNGRSLDEFREIASMFRTPLEIHNHIPEQEPPKVEIADGAFRSETTVEPAQVTVESPQVTVEAPPPANVTVEPTRIEEGAIQVNVEPPDVDVTVERGGKRRIDYGDGRSAVVTDGDAQRIDFDDGDSVTITDLPDDE